MPGTPDRIGPKRVSRPRKSPRDIPRPCTPPPSPDGASNVAGFRWAMKQFGAAWGSAAFGQIDRVT
jgi:hypothetical protein